MFHEPSHDEKVKAMAAVGLAVQKMHQEVIRCLNNVKEGDIPLHLSEMASTLWPMLNPEIRKGWQLLRGTCGIFPHTWFRYVADPTQVVEPSWIWLIDPAAPIGMQQGDMFTMPSIGILPPWSIFATQYRGRKEAE